MSEYNEYVTAVNKIFDYLTKMKTGWNSLDNHNYIENIEQYKQTVISNVELFKKNAPSQHNNTESLEALGND